MTGMEVVTGELSTGRPLRIITVCTGNICRSPMAEAILRGHLDAGDRALSVTVDSAGTHGYHIGADADPRARRVLAERGYHLAHRARQFERDWLQSRDLILAMDAGHLRDLRAMARRAGTRTDHIRTLRDFDPEGPGDVPDPYYDTVEQFREVADIIERSMPALLRALPALGGTQ